MLRSLKWLLACCLLLFIFAGCSKGAVTGDPIKFTFEDAKKVVTQDGLLKTVENVEPTPPGPVYLAISGKDENGQDKVIWLQSDKNGKPQVADSVLLKDGISQNKVKEILKEQGINESIIKKIQLVPFRTKMRIAWYVEVESNGSRQHYWYDFKTSELLFQN